MISELSGHPASPPAGDAREIKQLYSAQVRTRNFGSMIRKLSVTWSQKVSQFLGTSSRRKVSIALLKSLKLP